MRALPHFLIGIGQAAQEYGYCGLGAGSYSIAQVKDLTGDQTSLLDVIGMNLRAQNRDLLGDFLITQNGVVVQVAEHG
jgi:uncharacterized protein (DUF2141 family)